MVHKSVSDMFTSGYRTVRDNLPLVGVFILLSILNSGSNLVTNTGESGINLPTTAIILLAILSLLISLGLFAIRAILYCRQYNREINPATYINGIQRFKKRILSIIGIQIIYITSVLIGFVFLIIPGIYIAYKLFLAVKISIIEDESAIRSLKKSWSYTSGNFITILVLLIVSGILSLMLLGVVGVLATLGIFSPVFIGVAVLTLPLFYVINIIVDLAVADLAIAIGQETGNI